MKSVVTGSNGFIGSHLAAFLLENNHEVVGLDTAAGPSNFFQSIVNIKSDNFRYVSSDIRINNAMLESIVKESDVIFHLAASVGIPNYINSPVELFEVNVIGSYNLVNLCLKHNKKIIFSSTSEIYGKNPAVPWGENADRILGNTEITRWNYSTSKATIEHLLNSLKGKLQYKILRYFNVYGPGQKPIFLISRAIHNGLNNKELQVYDNGSQTRCFTYIDDAIKATYLVSNLESKHNTFNIGNDYEVSINSVMRVVSSYFPRSSVVDINTADIYGVFYEDLTRRIPDVTRISSETNWKSEVQIGQGIQLFVNWAKQNEFWWNRNNETR
jgi:UDP-glucose 4-epimerase